jgi:large subunit ribosomal protein L10
MPPRLSSLTKASTFLISAKSSRFYATAAAASVFSPPEPQIAQHPPTQPPSHRAADARKTQLHRFYLSVLRSTPLMLVFQHNNLRAVEWVALRREVKNTLSKLTPATDHDEIAQGVRIMMIRSGVFSSAIRVAEYYDPKNCAKHGTSREAYAMTKMRKNHPLSSLVVGPIGIVTFPAVSPQHIKAVVDLMFPENRPAKGLDPLALSGLQKLILLAARVDGDVASGRLGAGEILDATNVRWVSALPGFEALRGQLVGMLQSVGGADLVRSLEAIPTSVVRTVDAHRKVLGGELQVDAKLE